MSEQPIDPLLDLYVQAAVSRKAHGVIVLDVRGLTSIADVFIICSGRSNRQVKAIADHVERFLRQKKVHPLSVEGKNDGHWVLIDYGHVLIHIFYEETRRFYDLEGLWIDAKRISTASLKGQIQEDAGDFDGKEIIVE
jgi:ribosome-associated protein